FGHIILVAPDVDKELFEEYSYLYNEHSEMSTLYVSSEDKAVRASYKIHQNNRVGLSPPVVVEKGIDTIHASSVVERALWDLGHSYYAEAEALILDMHELLTSSVEAKKRQKLQKVEVLNKRYWQLNLV
ncbi:MAG TPA: alpha/beta hydrolase, partial [Arcobacter sp.]|nr:alpha/beta hydrolase [Arcobacter sp.]